MNKIKCHKCGKLYTHRGDYNKHMKRKTSCIAPQKKFCAIFEPQFSCPKCNRTYVHKRSLTKHMRTCCLKTKPKITFDDNTIDYLEDLRDRK